METVSWDSRRVILIDYYLTRSRHQLRKRSHICKKGNHVPTRQSAVVFAMEKPTSYGLNQPESKQLLFISSPKNSTQRIRIFVKRGRNKHSMQFFHRKLPSTIKMGYRDGFIAGKSVKIYKETILKNK